MKCKNVKKKLIFLSEKPTLTNEEKDVVAHLENCSSCRKQYDYLTKIEYFINEERALDVSPYFYTRLSGKFESTVPAPRLKQQPAWIMVAQGGIVAAIIFVAVLSGFTLGLNDSKYMNDYASGKSNKNSQTHLTPINDQSADNFPTY